MTASSCGNKSEQPISIPEVPYHNLKPLVLKTVGRAKNRAGWHRGASSKRSRAPLEIDNDLSCINLSMEDEEHGILRTVQTGGNLACNETADFNQDVSRVCSYCNQDISTQDHIKWECSFFAPVRKEIDAELAGVPHRYLPSCIKSGIAPAMKADGRKTFWGADFGEDLDEGARKLLGGNRELHINGSDARKTEERKAAVDILEDPRVEGYNAREIMLKYKAAHGSGNNLTFPDAEQIKGNMQGYPEDFKVDIYGDGSHTSAIVWWAALGVFGIWMPKRANPSRGSHDDNTGPTHLEQSSSSSCRFDGEWDSHICGKMDRQDGYVPVAANRPGDLAPLRKDGISCPFYRVLPGTLVLSIDAVNR